MGSIYKAESIRVFFSIWPFEENERWESTASHNPNGQLPYKALYITGMLVAALKAKLRNCPNNSKYLQFIFIYIYIYQFKNVVSHVSFVAHCCLLSFQIVQLQWCLMFFLKKIRKCVAQNVGFCNLISKCGRRYSRIHAVWSKSICLRETT